jgi:spermidine/putrescine transport system permease protein
MVLPLYAAVERLDRSLIEAARDLYAPGWAVFTRVIVPLAKPGIVAGCLLVFIPSFGAYITPDLLGGAQTTTAAKLIQVLFTSGRDWPYGSALGFILMILTLGGTLLALRSLRRETFA